MIKGIDVSSYQGKIDWDKVKASGIGFAILRCGWGSDNTRQDDSQFARNVAECKRVGMPFGVYLYSYANSIEKAKSEAQHVLRLIKGLSLSYPVFYDLEDAGTTQKCSKYLIADMTEAFCDCIEKAGYKAAVYSNKYWFTTILTDSRFSKYDKWVAMYANKCTYAGKYTMWQYSSKGSVPGIVGAVDMNYCYVDYPGTILGSTVPKKEPEKKPQNDSEKVTFIKAVQSAIGAKVDGIAGPETLSKTVTVSVKSNSKHAVVKPIQTYLNSIGYNCGAVDGVFGTKTAAAVKKYQKEVVKASIKNQDGIITKGAATWKKLLGMA